MVMVVVMVVVLFHVHMLPAWMSTSVQIIRA